MVLSNDTLRQRKSKYQAHKLECQALKWAVYEMFWDYLQFVWPTFLPIPFLTVITDNNPLTYIFSTAKLDAMPHQCKAELSFFFQFFFKSTASIVLQKL